MYIKIIAMSLIFILCFCSCYNSGEISLENDVVTYSSNPYVVSSFAEITEENAVTLQAVDETEEACFTVYITPSGKKYHYSKTCSGKNGYSVEISYAIGNGKEPCKKCVKDVQ